MVSFLWDGNFDDPSMNDDVLPEIVTTNVNKKKEVRENDAMQKESAKKKRKFQEKKGEKKEKDTKIL